MRLAIITTHPIQYYAPVFKLIHRRQKISIKVFYTFGDARVNRYDYGFEREISWDIPLLSGYPYEWIKNTAKKPGTHHFKGIDNHSLIDKIKVYNPDALLVYGWNYRSHLRTIFHFKNKIPVFFRGDSTLLDEKIGIRAFAKSFFLKWLYRHVDYSFYSGTNNKAYFKKYGFQENQLGFTPHAIDNDRFAVDRTHEALQLREQFGIANNAIMILFAGKFERKKDPLLLLEAFLKITKKDLHLLYVGNGTLEKDLKEKAQENRNIHFMDFQNQTYMPVVYQSCDIFCLPSKGPAETWGLVVNEAMACSKTILVSDKVGCAVDLVKDYYNGLIFRNGHLEELIRCLNELTKSKDLLIEYGAHSKSIIMKWDFLTVAKEIESKLN
jgi:glycosyltransferase involved in cell wall biosynthesis